MEPIAPRSGGVPGRLLVVPGASRSEITGRHGDAVKVRVAAPPEGGKANRAVVALIRKVTGCKTHLVSGAGSRTKVVSIDDIDPVTAARLLGA
jgi:uncharacterized protein (TIGR00251 family)